MNQLVHYTNCPVCNSAEIKIVISAKDYTVSKEIFQIAECSVCSLRFTQDVPGKDSIGPYYKSEEYISHTNTSKGLINRLYQTVRKRTLKQKRNLIQNFTGLQKGSLLDVGSGTGAFVNEMKLSGWKIKGLEPDADARKIGKQEYKLELEDSSSFYELPAYSYDAITMWHVLEHVHELHDYLSKLKSLLKAEGKLFIAVPNFTSKDAAIYREYWAAYDVPRHLYHFSPKAMQVLMEKHGLKILKHQPMWYDSFYVSMLSSKYKNGTTDLAASFYNGLLSNLNAINDVKKCSSVIYIIGK